MELLDVVYPEGKRGIAMTRGYGILLPYLKKRGYLLGEVSNQNLK
jgi:hypothetical protein